MQVQAVHHHPCLDSSSLLMVATTSLLRSSNNSDGSHPLTPGVIRNLPTPHHHRSRSRGVHRTRAICILSTRSSLVGLSFTICNLLPLNSIISNRNFLGNLWIRVHVESCTHDRIPDEPLPPLDGGP